MQPIDFCWLFDSERQCIHGAWRCGISHYHGVKHRLAYRVRSRLACFLADQRCDGLPDGGGALFAVAYLSQVHTGVGPLGVGTAGGLCGHPPVWPAGHGSAVGVHGRGQCVVGAGGRLVALGHRTSLSKALAEALPGPAHGRDGADDGRTQRACRGLHLPAAVHLCGCGHAALGPGLVGVAAWLGRFWLAFHAGRVAALGPGDGGAGGDGSAVPAGRRHFCSLDHAGALPGQLQLRAAAAVHRRYSDGLRTASYRAGAPGQPR